MNEIFTNPSILKVLHGSDFDVIWLQKDFGVYIVNMFDTGQVNFNFNLIGSTYINTTFIQSGLSIKRLM